MVFGVFGLEEEDAFGTFVEEQVDDAHIGQKAVACGIHLIVGAWHELGIGQWVLGAYGFAEVGNALIGIVSECFGIHIGGAYAYVGAHIKERAERRYDVDVEVG